MPSVRTQAVKSLETADLAKLRSILGSGSSLPMLDLTTSSTTQPPDYRADSSGRRLVRDMGLLGRLNRLGWLIIG